MPPPNTTFTAFNRLRGHPTRDAPRVMHAFGPLWLSLNLLLPAGSAVSRLVQRRPRCTAAARYEVVLSTVAQWGLQSAGLNRKPMSSAVGA